MPQIRAHPFQLRCKPAQEKLLRRYAGEPFSNYMAMAKWLTARRNAPDPSLRHAPD